MARAYNVVDVDGHILEPLDLWDNYIDPEFRERRPRFVIDENGKERLSVEGKLLGNPRGIGSLGSVGVRQGLVKANTLKTATVHPIPQGVKLAKEAVAHGAWPVVLADHSDRSGSATWVLQQVIAQDLADVLIATIADRAAVEAVVAKGLKASDPFDMDVGGLADESAGQPVRIEGTIAGVAHIAGRHWVSVAFGRGNVVLISEYLTQVMDPLDLTGPGFTIDQFKVFAIKSRVHFRRGFDDSGFAKTILLVEPEQPFLGTVRVEALPYRNVDISKFYPYGDVSFPE